MDSSADAARLTQKIAPNGAQTVVITGALDAKGVATLWNQATQMAGQVKGGLTVDASGVSQCDGAGMALLLEMRRLAEAAGAVFRLSGLQPRFAALRDQFSPSDIVASDAGVAAPSLPEEVGRHAYAMMDDIVSLVAFVGEFSLAVVKALAKPRRVRWKDVLQVAENAGANAVPIVVLIGFLMGLIMSFQSAMPLRQFGAEIFVANLLALSLLRELGPLVTAILLAGRSGSAFAAELGTMTVNEEINALVTMGLDPVRFLVVTRVLAAMAMTPLLTMFFNIAGLIGGALVMLSLGFPLVSFLNQVHLAVTMGDMFGGLAKSAVFGLLVCAIGCQRGLRTRGGASAVGNATTSAVVSGIVLIAVSDGVFAVVFYVLGW